MGTKLFWRVSSTADPWGNNPHYLWTAGLAGFSVGLKVVRKRKISCSPLHRSSSALVANSLAQLLYRLSCSDSSILTVIWHILLRDDAKYRSYYRISILWKRVCRPCGEKDGSQIYTWSPKQSFVRSPVTIWQQYHWQTGAWGGSVWEREDVLFCRWVETLKSSLRRSPYYCIYALASSICLRCMANPRV